VLLGRAAGERAWRRAMSRCVMPGGNASDDIDRLAVERPLVAGRRLALRIEGASVGLPVFGAMLLGPALFVAARGAVVAGGYPEVAALEDALIRLAPWLAFSGVGGLVVALVLRGGLRRWTTAQLGRRVLAFAGIATVLLPFLAVAGAAALLGALALLGVRRERRRLGLGDSHAAALDSGLGRALAAAARTSWSFLTRSFARARALLPTRRRVLVLVALAVGVGFGIGLAAIPARTLAPIPVLVTLPPEPAVVPVPIRVPVVEPPAAAATACVCP